MSIGFISDLHLSHDNVTLTRGFLSFLDNNKDSLDQLYILGDLFEIWIGDDDQSDFIQIVKNALKQFTELGIETFFLHGNRDFLIGDDFIEDTGLKFIPDPFIFEIFGKRCAVSHGDDFCTLDIEYHNFKKNVRSSQWKSEFLSQSLQKRNEVASSMRETSKKKSSNKNVNIMDVEISSVENFLSETNVDILIHGHTHKPQIHNHKINDRHCERIVLGDWDDNGWCLRFDSKGHTLEKFKL